jgi:hypothetical protein
MNIFDMGGIVAFIALVVSIIGGTGLFLFINTIFEIRYFGFGAMAGEWFVCVIICAFIINFLGGIFVGFLSVVWFIAKIALLIAVLLFVGHKIKDKITNK